jgi:2-amino-4-hydroxy-6-hydroxymethyldihydropteridine diphosphokinase
MTTGYISVGSNIDKEIHIPSCLKALQKLFGHLTLSSLYESTAVGFIGDTFHNLIVKFESELDAKQVAKLLRQIELDHGRSHTAPKFSSRTLDLDLILYGTQIISDGRLQIPRNEIECYAFVLEPLAEIAASELHPMSQQSFGTLWQNFDKENLTQKRIDSTWLSDI